MRSASPVRWIVPAAITVLALADGVLHFTLDFILFHGRFFGSPFAGSGPPPPPSGGSGGPPPGPPPNPLLLHLNELFLLNAIGYLALVVLFWLAVRWLGGWRWLVDAALAVMAVASIAGWIAVGEPNPNGLGYLSKVIEVLLIAAAAVDLWGRRPAGRAQPSAA